jgi:putative MATE family efflux protein
VGLAAITFWTIISLFVGTLHGVSTFSAQHYGAGDFARCGRDGWLVLFLTVPFALVLMSVTGLCTAIFEIIGTKPSIVPHASDYMFIRLMGAFFVLINYGVVSFLRGVGDTRTPMYFTIGANVLNIGFNYYLILAPEGPKMGAGGAALGSVLATAVFSIGYVIFFLTGERNRLFKTRTLVKPRARELFDFLKTGMPIGGTWALEMASWTAFMAIISYFGVVALAATEVVFEVLHFSFQGAIALGTAATTLVGQYLGADKVKIAEKSARSTMCSSVVYCVTMGLIFLVFRRQIMQVFTLDHQVIEVGQRLFIYVAIFQFFDGLAISCNGVIRGAGDTRWSMVFMVIMAWGLFLPLTYVLTLKAELGIDGAWISATLFITLVGIGLYLRYRSGKWKTMRV